MADASRPGGRHGCASRRACARAWVCVLRLPLAQGHCAAQQVRTGRETDLATADADALLDRGSGRPLSLPLGDEPAGDGRLEHVAELALRWLLPGAAGHASRCTRRGAGYSERPGHRREGRSTRNLWSSPMASSSDSVRAGEVSWSGRDPSPPGQGRPRAGSPAGRPRIGLPVPQSGRSRALPLTWLASCEGANALEDDRFMCRR